MIDPEFNHDRRLATWVDTVSGNIWLTAYDAATGEFTPASGRGTLIERGVSVGGDFPGLGFTINGPEWALGESADYIVYTRNNAPGDPTRANALVGVAYENPDGSWARQSLATPRRYGPYGSVNRNDVARVSYQNPAGAQFVRAVADPETEVQLPGFSTQGFAPPTVRFVEQSNLVVYDAEIDGRPQAVVFNLDTQELTQLTFDDTDKDQSWMWPAPELGGALGLLTNLDKKTMAFYRPVPNGSGGTAYELLDAVRAPQRGTWFSLEPFVHNGRSYVVAQLTPLRSGHPTSLWLVGLDPDVPLLRQLTPEGLPTEARADPEIVRTANGVIVVYSKFDTTQCTSENASRWLCMQGLQGLFRADTGLPPPQ